MVPPIFAGRIDHRERVRMAAVGVLAGLMAGCVSGLGARLAMRIVALAVGQQAGFSLEGTLGIIVIGTVFGAPIGLLFVATRHLLPKSGLVGGATLGFVLLLICTLPLALVNEELMIAPKLGTLLFSTLFVVAGATAGVMTDPLARRVPPPRLAFLPLAGYGALLGLGIVGTGLFLAAVLSALLGIDI